MNCKTSVLFLFTIFAFGALLKSSVAEDPKVTFKDDGKNYLFKFGEKPILRYNHAVIQPPKGIDPLYARSGHIHPLFTPKGKVVTDDFSDDHAHQHGLFNAIVKAKVDGETLDFWNQHRKNANVRYSGVTKTKKNSMLKTHQEHYRLRDNKVVFKETWTIEPSFQKGCFVIDFTMELKNATAKKVIIQKNHYGSFGLRGSGQWRNPGKTDFEFTTASGKHRSDGNQSREQWVAMHGKIDGSYCGIAVISHPKNFRHPEPARLHPKMPYFSFAPMSLGSFEIKPGETYHSKFRIVTFDDELNPKTISHLSKFK